MVEVDFKLVENRPPVVGLACVALAERVGLEARDDLVERLGEGDEG